MYFELPGRYFERYWTTVVCSSLATLANPKGQPQGSTRTVGTNPQHCTARCWLAAWRCSAVPVDPARAGGSGRGWVSSRRARGRPARVRQRPPRHAAWRRRENVCRGRRLSRSVWPSHVFTAHVLPRRPRPRAVIVHHVFTHRVGALPGPTERQVAVTALCVCEQFHAPSNASE